MDKFFIVKRFDGEAFQDLIASTLFPREPTNQLNGLIRFSEKGGHAVDAGELEMGGWGQENFFGLQFQDGLKFIDRESYRNPYYVYRKACFSCLSCRIKLFRQPMNGEDYLTPKLRRYP
jgi:hypothetical protein